MHAFPKSTTTKETHVKSIYSTALYLSFTLYKFVIKEKHYSVTKIICLEMLKQ